MPQIDINSTFELVLDFINKTSRSVFLTGKAGTGKTTLLKHIRSNTHKQMAVCAPTGVAAINAGGSTIHSLFQFPFSPFVPGLLENGDIDPSGSNLPPLKYNNQRLAILRSLELLVIDEVSMVRADLLDQIDIALRVTRRNRQQPFGGVQLLLIGDMHQLPPVALGEEWTLLKQHYRSPYFFDSHVIQRFAPVHIELTKVYRQSDQAFITLLNKVRHNELDKESLASLNARYNPDVSDGASGITLTTHNRKADEINARNLERLPGRQYSFVAETEGIFPEKNYPAPETLELKVGARVMFLRNNPEKGYYNGKTGEVTALTEKTVTVSCEEDGSEINVGPEVWSNITYKVERSAARVSEEIIGSFLQVPLRPAWAITIHKSQGLTFDKVTIDAAEAFTAGQVYVALSRCRSLSGLRLSSRIGIDSLENDRQILSFSKGRQDEGQLKSILGDSRRGFLHGIIEGVFDFSFLSHSRKQLASLQTIHSSRLDEAGRGWMGELFGRIDAVLPVETKFRAQLAGFSQQGVDPEADQALQERIRKASGFFGNETALLLELIKKCALTTESREAADELNAELQELWRTLHLKKHLLSSCAGGFTFDGYIRSKLSVQIPPFGINVYASASNSRINANIDHPKLYRQLLLLRDEICNEDRKPLYLVAGAKTLAELANHLPTTSDQLLCISGFGRAKVEAFGERFLKVIREYREENNISGEFTVAPGRRKKRKEKEKDPSSVDAERPGPSVGATRVKTFEMFSRGMSPEEIARERNLATGTVLSHLVPFVAVGKLDVSRLVSLEKQELIRNALVDFDPAEGLSKVKSRLPDDVSFADIKFMVAHRLSESGAVLKAAD